MFPGTGFVELAIRAGDEVGCSVVDELTLQAPLMLPALGIGCGAGGRGSRRRIRPAQRVDIFPGRRRFRLGVPRRGRAEPRIGRAGRRSVGVAAAPARSRSTWPTAMSGWRRSGYGYGPAFRGLTAMWRRGDEFFAEVKLPDAAGGVERIRRASGAAGCGAARGGDGPSRRRRRGSAVLLAGRVAACRGCVGGTGADCAVGSPTRRCRSNWPTGWVCRCCRWRRWWPAR